MSAEQHHHYLDRQFVTVAVCFPGATAYSFEALAARTSSLFYLTNRVSYSCAGRVMWAGQDTGKRMGALELLVFGGTVVLVAAVGGTLLYWKERQKQARMSPEEREQCLTKGAEQYPEEPAESHVPEREEGLAEEALKGEEPAENHDPLHVAETSELTPQKTSETSAVLFGGFALLFVLVTVFSVCSGFNCSGRNQSGGTSDPDGDKAMAITMAQKFVKEELKSPSSASFPWGFDEYRATKGSDGRWSVSGWVESINSFNAKVRVRWSVEMKREGTNWKLFSINIQG